MEIIRILIVISRLTAAIAPWCSRKVLLVATTSNWHVMIFRRRSRRTRYLGAIWIDFAGFLTLSRGRISECSGRRKGATQTREAKRIRWLRWVRARVERRMTWVHSRTKRLRDLVSRIPPTAWTNSWTRSSLTISIRRSSSCPRRTLKSQMKKQMTKKRCEPKYPKTTHNTSSTNSRMKITKPPISNRQRWRKNPKFPHGGQTSAKPTKLWDSSTSLWTHSCKTHQIKTRISDWAKNHWRFRNRIRPDKCRVMDKTRMDNRCARMKRTTWWRDLLRSLSICCQALTSSRYRRKIPWLQPINFKIVTIITIRRVLTFSEAATVPVRRTNSSLDTVMRR